MPAIGAIGASREQELAAALKPASDGRNCFESATSSEADTICPILLVASREANRGGAGKKLGRGERTFPPAVVSPGVEQRQMAVFGWIDRD